MAYLEVLITFSDTTVGNVHCQILGAHTKFEFDVTATDDVKPHVFNLRPNVYSIQIAGSSGGTVKLTVTQADNKLVDISDDPKSIFILSTFAVN